MKIEIYLDDESKDEQPSKPTVFQRRVAKMLAERAGRKKVSAMDMKMAADLEEDAAEGEDKS